MLKIVAWLCHEPYQPGYMAADPTPAHDWITFNEREGKLHGGEPLVLLSDVLENAKENSTIQNPSKADGWDENVQYLLNRCPYTIWQRPGGGQVDMLSSLIVTFLGMQQKLDNFSGTSPLTNAEIIDIVKSVHGGMHILEKYPYTLPLLIAAVEQAILQRKRNQSANT